jgi:hypothetical protein
LTCFFHPFNVVASALLHTQRIEKFGEPSKNKSKKARPRLSIVSFSTLQTPSIKHDYQFPLFRRVSIQLLKLSFPLKGYPLHYF